MAEEIGNHIPLPGFTAETTLTDDEILSSYAGFTQRGVTIKTGQALAAGTVMARETSTKQWVAYDGTPDGTNEVVTLTENTNVTAGVFTLTFGGEETADIAFNATAATVQAALEALSTIGAGNVTVTGGLLTTTPFTITFVGSMAEQDIGAITSDQSGLTGTFDIAVGTAGVGTGVTVARGVLRKAVNTTSPAGAVLGNIVTHGVMKLDKIVGLDSEAITDLKARVDSVLNEFTI